MPKPPLPDDVVEFLSKPNPAVMATVSPQGAPVSVATWYLWDVDTDDTGEVLINLDVGRKRLEHLRGDPRVSLTVLDEESWYRHVSLQGRASLIDDPDMVDIDRLARHYTGKPYAVRNRGRISARIAIEAYHTWGRG